MPPTAVTITPQIEGVTNTLKLSGIETGARWEYALDHKGPWSPGTGIGLGTVGNGLASVWLRQLDVAGNPSEAQGFQTYLIHGVVVRGDADYVRWDIPKGQQLVSVKLSQYVSEDAISFYALQANRVFDTGVIG